MDEIVSKEVMKKISKDLDDYIGLKLTHRQLSAKFDSLQKEVEKISADLLQVSVQLEKANKEIKEKDLMLAKAYKMMEGYRALALAKTLELVKANKWRGKYYALGAVKLLTVSIPIAAFLVGSYLIMEAVK